MYHKCPVGLTLDQHTVEIQCSYVVTVSTETLQKYTYALLVERTMHITHVQ